MQAIQKTLSEFKPAIAASKNFKAVLNLYINCDPQQYEVEIFESLQVDLSVKLFYCNDQIHGPNTLFCVLRDYLVLERFKYQHQKNNKLTYGIVSGFYTLSENRTFVLKRLATLQVNVTTAAPVQQGKIFAIPNQVYNVYEEQDNEQKLTHYVSQRFERVNWFTGKIGEDVLDFIKKYKEAFADYTFLR